MEREVSGANHFSNFERSDAEAAPLLAHNPPGGDISAPSKGTKPQPALFHSSRSRCSACDRCGLLYRRCGLQMAVFTFVVSIILVSALIRYLVVLLIGQPSGSSQIPAISFKTGSYPALTASYPWSIVEPHVATTVTLYGVSYGVESSCAWVIETPHTVVKRSGCDPFEHVFDTKLQLYSVRVSVNGEAEVGFHSVRHAAVPRIHRAGFG